MKKIWLLLGAVSVSLCAGQAFAQVSAQKAAELGKSLTPIGAEKAGSKDGVIPAWTGGEPQRGSIHKPVYPSDPSVDKDKPVLTITHDNYQKYADKLNAGQKELLKRYPDYKMIVYPTHRVASFPDFIYKKTMYNATHCKLEGTDTPDGCQAGFPYPIPTNGAQIIWNHKLKWRGNEVRRYNEQAIVQPDGSYQKTVIREDVKFFIPNSNHPDYTLTPDNRLYLYYLSQTLAPPRLAGTFILVHERTGVGSAGRVAWLYSPGLRRIRRAPNVQYDNPYEGTDGNEFYDQVDMFNGNLALYNWKLIGKKEMYIPYDNNRVNYKSTKFSELIRPHHMNQDLLRYELHRVWIVEADLKPGKSHIFKKRVMYVDEDTWNIVAEDDYDNRGNLYKYHEGYLVFVPEVQLSSTVPEVIYDFFSGRYFITAAINGAEPDKFDIHFSDDYFTPASVQKSTLR